jgi:hypothetical protein
MTKLIFIGVMLATLGACSHPEPDLKSPCVGTDDSPCVRRNPVLNPAMRDSMMQDLA